MATPKPNTKLPAMERFGVRYLHRVSRRKGGLDRVHDRAHHLDEEQRRAMHKTIRRGIWRGVITGALAGLLGALVDIGTDPDIIDPAFLPAPRWVLLTLATTLVAVVEIAYLYWVCLEGTHALTHDAGLELSEDDKPVEERFLHRALARAALEIPNPMEPAYQINPRGEVSRLWLVLLTVLYKAKVGLTNFLFKALVRRMLARFGVRYAAAFVAVPVIALWNAWVCWRVLSEARLRVTGPSAASELAEILIDPWLPDLRPQVRQNLFASVASVARCKGDIHPNLLEFLREMVKHLGEPAQEHDYSSRTFIQAFPKLAQEEQTIVLRVFAAATVIDGHLNRRERRLLEKTYQLAGVPLPLEKIKTLGQNIAHGEGLDPELLRSLA